MSTRVGIAELKAHLSEYVARAKAGERIVVCDRNTPVAELRQTIPEREPLPITPATRPWNEATTSVHRLPLPVGVDAVALLVAERENERNPS